MSNVKELFGTQVFNDETMRERLPKDVYKALQKTMQKSRSGLCSWSVKKPGQREGLPSEPASIHTGWRIRMSVPPVTAPNMRAT